MQDLLNFAGEYIDIWKFGYGLSYIDRHLTEKLALLKSHSVDACPGGTLAEIAWIQRAIDPYFDWLQQLGVTHVEISNGATPMATATKRDLITAAAGRGFVVFAEVGSKDPKIEVTPESWAAQARADLAAGATWIVAEGRESGNVGLYKSDGEVRSDLVDVLEALDAEASIIYEAPQRSQQAWLIRHVGPNVNIGNVAADGALSLEALRLGLRADTIGWVAPGAERGGVERQCST